MKEDAARRRHFELLVEHLGGGTPQLRYRHETGRELADDVYARFAGKCFNCGRELPPDGSWHLDHTRPLALLWPLDASATALCRDCNSQKRDRIPGDFYSTAKLEQLSQLTGVPVQDLTAPTPNMEIVTMFLANLQWFFDVFLLSADMTRVHDGKVAGEVLVKALQKVLERCRGGAPIDLVAEYENRRARGTGFPEK